jgi:hypothetical protein
MQKKAPKRLFGDAGIELLLFATTCCEGQNAQAASQHTVGSWFWNRGRHVEVAAVAGNLAGDRAGNRQGQRTGNVLAQDGSDRQWADIAGGDISPFSVTEVNDRSLHPVAVLIRLANTVPLSAL